jgi:acyl carrier protein
VEEVIKAYISDEIVSDSSLLPLDNDLSLMEANILDSVAFLNLVLFLEERFGISVEDTELTRDNFETINIIAAFVRQKQQAGVAA